MPAASGTRWSRKAHRAASAAGRPALRSARKGRAVALTTLSGEIEDAPRICSGIAELDRVTGGGFVRGSALLVGGDPGIGKSTLLMQAAAALAQQGHRVVYVSGEEAVAQIRLRAQRLGAADAPVELAAETNVEDILATLAEGKRPDLVIIDSIQTLWTDIADSAPGTVTQVRASAQAMIRYAKSTGAAVVLVGHVTKEGQIAGPRVVEHMVDAVLYFEGEGGHHFRILRAVKNRFGADRRDRRVRNVGQGPARSRQPVGTVPRRAQRQGAGRGGVRRHGGHAAGAGRDPGAGRALAARHAAPRRRRLGFAAARDGARGARSALRRALRHARRLSQCRRRLPHHPSRPPILAVAAALVSSLPVLPFRPIASISAKSAFRAPSGRSRMREQRLKEAEKLGFRQAVLPLGGAEELPSETGLSAPSELPTLADLVVRIAGSHRSADAAD